MQRRSFLSTLGTGIAVAGISAGASDPQPVRVAVIGHTGRGDYGHGLDTMWQGVPDSQVVAVADADPAGLEAAAARLPGAAPFADYRKMLLQMTPDVVAVAPRHIDQHHAMLQTAIEHGARGIYVEKPFVRTPAEADEIRVLCEKHGTRLAVAHRNRWHPVLPVIRQLVQDGAIGRLLEARGRGKEDSRGGSQDLWVLGTHVINLAEYLLGSLTSVSACILADHQPAPLQQLVDGPEGLGPLIGDELHARFETSSGVPFFFDSIRNARLRTAAVSHPASFGLQLTGTAGIIDLRIDREPLAAILSGSPFDPDFAAPRQWVPISSSGIGAPETHPSAGRSLALHHVSGSDLLNSLKEDRQPLCDVRQGCSTVEAVCSIFESHRRGGLNTPLPLTQRQHPLLSSPGSE